MFRFIQLFSRNVAMTALKKPRDPLIVIIGATGTGKSQLAVDIAIRHNGEVINGDAMQMYDGLPIITNKITTEEQQGIPHHLLGFINPKDEPWRVGLFKNEASRLIKEIRSRGRLPILVGGTHYYTQTLLLDDTLVSEAVERDDDDIYGLTRQEINDEFPILDGSTPEILKRLQEVDPIMASRWHPNDRRKIRRSLEIYLMTGRKASDVYAEQKRQRDTHNDSTASGGQQQIPSLSSSLIFWVHAENERLKTRLDDRVEKMIQQGLMDEVKSLKQFLHDQTAAGVTIDQSSGIWVAIGFKEFEPYITALGREDITAKDVQALLSESIERTKSSTRQYAKRQIRWIRLKLLPALARQNASERLYLLDGSDLARWSEDVSAPAMAIVQNFLGGMALPSATELSSVANELLTVRRSFEFSDRPDLWVQHVCEICNTTSVTEEQWQTHLHSRSHRAKLRKARRIELRHERKEQQKGHGDSETHDGESLLHTQNEKTIFDS